MTTVDVHPWRTKREFLKIFEKASPKNKYSKTIPKNLISLRQSLDMTQKVKKKVNYSTAETILPQLKVYENEPVTKEEHSKKKMKEEEP